MAQTECYNRDKKKVGMVELADDVFMAKVNIPLVQQVIKAQLAARRQGNAKVKTRTEVSGGGKKPFKQKGTGNARRGSSRSPIIVGGGQVFGPKPRSYKQRTPRKMVRGALCSALSDRHKEKQLFVIDDLKFEKPQSKDVHKIVDKAFSLKNALVVDQPNRNLELSGRNVKNVKVLRTDQLNVYDIVKHDSLIMTKGALEVINKRLHGVASSKPAARTTSTKGGAA